MVKHTLGLENERRDLTLEAGINSDRWDRNPKSRELNFNPPVYPKGRTMNTIRSPTRPTSPAQGVLARGHQTTAGVCGATRPHTAWEIIPAVI